MTITEMLAYLAEQGWSQDRIAKQCGTTQPTIFRITKGSTPSFDVGTAIVALYKKAKRKPSRDAKKCASE